MPWLTLFIGKPVLKPDFTLGNFADFCYSVKVGLYVAAPVAPYNGLVFTYQRGNVGIRHFLGFHVLGKCHVFAFKATRALCQ